MEEKNGRSLKILLIMFTVVIIAMGIVIYKLYNQNVSANMKVNELTYKISDLENVVNNSTMESEEKTNNSVSNEEKINNSVSKQEKNGFSEDERKEAIQKVFDLYAEANAAPENILINDFDYMNVLEYYKNHSEYDEGTEPIKIGDTRYRLTKIKYSEFENKILEYMTKNCLETKFSYYKEYKGYLAVEDYAASGSGYKVKSIESTDSNVYIVNMICYGLSDYDEHGNIKKGAGEETLFDVEFQNINGKCVVESFSYHNS